MKKIIRLLLLVTILMGFGGTRASAQYYAIANQIPQLIQPALVGGFNYKGYVEAKYLKGVGKYNADFLGFSTSQGFKYSNWFFMGVGLGVDVVFSNADNDGAVYRTLAPGMDGKSTITTGVMIPIFTDFRFNLGSQSSASFYGDIKIGCSFLCSDNYLRVGDGYLSSQQYFYLRPSIGVRIPVSKQNPKQAVNVGATYQLLTSNYWNAYYSNVTVNAVGVDVSFEW